MTNPLIVGDSIGGQPKTRYWTPDGRELLRAPCMRGTTKGEVRDANLDFGWLTEKPTELKLYCAHCDKWHDTSKEIVACGEKKKATEAKFLRLAQKMSKNEVSEKSKEIDSLRSEIEELKNMVSKLIKG